MDGQMCKCCLEKEELRIRILGILAVYLSYFLTLTLPALLKQGKLETVSESLPFGSATLIYFTISWGGGVF